MVNTVKTEELIGFRNPEPSEQKRIYDYYAGQKKKSDNARNVGRTICIFFLITFVLGVLGLNKGDHSVGEWVVLSVLTLVLACVVFMINKARREAKEFLQLIEQGKYQVMDCVVYKARKFAQHNYDMAYIYNQYGQYCDTEFCIDGFAYAEWEKNKVVKCLLIKLTQNNFNYYEVLTPKKLEWR